MRWRHGAGARGLHFAALASVVSTCLAQQAGERDPDNGLNLDGRQDSNCLLDETFANVPRCVGHGRWFSDDKCLVLGRGPEGSDSYYCLTEPYKQVRTTECGLRSTSVVGGCRHENQIECYGNQLNPTTAEQSCLFSSDKFCKQTQGSYFKSGCDYDHDSACDECNPKGDFEKLATAFGLSAMFCLCFVICFMLWQLKTQWAKQEEEVEVQIAARPTGVLPPPKPLEVAISDAARTPQYPAGGYAGVAPPGEAPFVQPERPSYAARPGWRGTAVTTI